MNVSDLQTYNQAVSLANAGNLEQAHTLLVQLRQNNPADANVLVWFAYTTPDINEAREAIARAVQVEPGNSAVTQAQNWLTQWEQQQGTGGSPEISTSLSGWPSPTSAASSPKAGSSRRSPTPAASSKLDQMTGKEIWPPPQTTVYSAIVYPTSVSQSSTQPARSGGCGTKIILWSLGICVAFLVFIMGFGLIFGDDFDRKDGQALLNDFLLAAAAGNLDSAYSKVLPTISKDTLKTTFLDPNFGTLQNYSSLQYLTFTSYSAPDGKSLIIKGTIRYRYKTIDSSVFKANLQRVDSAGKWYIVSLTIAPLNQVVVL